MSHKQVCTEPLKSPSDSNTEANFCFKEVLDLEEKTEEEDLRPEVIVVVWMYGWVRLHI